MGKVLETARNPIHSGVVQGSSTVRTECIQETAFPDVWLADDGQVDTAAQALASSAVLQMALYVQLYFNDVVKDWNYKHLDVKATY